MRSQTGGLLVRTKAKHGEIVTEASFDSQLADRCVRCRYFNITVSGKKHENAIWYYPYPTHESSGVEGFISFYNREGTDIIIDGVKV